MAIVGCELSECGDAGLIIQGGGRAVLNDSYVYWNRGPGVRVEAQGVISLEHNDCSHNGGGPMVLDGSVVVRQRQRQSAGVRFFLSVVLSAVLNHCVWSSMRYFMSTMPSGGSV